MESSRKSFKALTLAQPIKKDINDTLVKLQSEKRKYLALEREEANLKEELQKAKRQLNEVKLLEPKTRVQENKNIQANMSISNTDRLYLGTLNRITQIKTKIDVHRKQIEKYKRLTKSIHGELSSIQQQNNLIESSLLNQQTKNQDMKNHLLDYRSLNMRNTDEFKSSFQALSRSEIKEENQRKKTQALRKSFYNNEEPKSSIIKLADLQNQHSSLHQLGQSNQHDIYMTNSIPLIKERIRIVIHDNKERIKISENYKKFGEELQNMFTIMKEYKGRDDVRFIADEFVMKEKQLKKIEQYIGKLQNRLMWYKTELQKIKVSDLELIKQLKKEENIESKVEDKNYINFQNQVKKSIEKLKQEEQENSVWFERIGRILTPLVQDKMTIINRTNIDKILGMIEQQYINEDWNQKEITQGERVINNKSTVKGNSFTIDDKELKAGQSLELMSYEKLREYAMDYISVKK